MKFKALVFSFVVFLVGCASFEKGVQLVDVDKPLSHIQRSIVAAIPLGVRKTERAGTEIYSQYFRPGEKRFIPSHSMPERYYAKVLIRGGRRPYTIEVFVFKEERAQTPADQVSSYVQVGQDQRLANMIRDQIKEQLSKRREDPNNIDDFRVF